MVDTGQELQVGRLGMRGAHQQRGAFTASQAQADVGKGFTQWAQGFEVLLYIAFDQRKQLPWQLHCFQAHAAVLELRLLGQRVERRLSEGIDAALEKAVAPVHGQKRLAGTHTVIAADGDDHAAATAFQADQVTLFEAVAA